MTAETVAWAKSCHVGNKNQRNVLLCLAGMSDGNGYVNAPVSLFMGLDGIDTRAKAERALNGLVDAGLLIKQWNPDSYSWTYKLQVNR